MGKCTYCNKLVKDPLLCTKCLLASYCSAQCASLDWIQSHAREEEEEQNVTDLVLGTGQSGEWSIWLGSVDALQDPSFIGHMDAIVSALGPNYDQQHIRQLIGPTKAHLRVTIWDSQDEDISQYFDVVADFIANQVKQNKHVLIHCVAGQSRSVTLLIYYMIRDLKPFKSVDEALVYLRKIRPTISPNRGFLRQLYEAEFLLKE